MKTDSRLVLAIYQSREHALEAREEIEKAHFRGSAAIHANDDGRLSFETGRVPPERITIALVVATVAGLVGVGLGTSIPILAVVSVSAFLLAWLTTIWGGFGIPRDILRRYSRFVLPGESIVLVRDRKGRVEDIVRVLRHISLPAIFTDRPRIETTTAPASDVDPTAPVGAGFAEHAAALAGSHELDPSLRSASLQPLLRATEDELENTRTVLAEVARLDHGLSHAGEWLLDNAYLIRSHIAEIRHNLPDDHDRILPVLRKGTKPRRPRIYRIAADLVQQTGLRATEEGIVSFLGAYQRHAPLITAELWVLPLMLRLVLLEHLAALSKVASLREHHKELAAFWADRLLTAAHRSPEAFDRMMRELGDAPPVFSPHFVARLGEQLYKDESALFPVQQWIEETTHLSLSETILREHGEESNDLALVASAIGSLRRLSQLDYPKIIEAVSPLETVLRNDPSQVYARSDFQTRDRCRRVVEACARQSATPEWEVARLAVDMAGRAQPDSREGTVAYYLLDRGLADLEKKVRRRVPWRIREQRLLRRYPTVAYLGSVTALTTAITAIFLLAAREAGVAGPWLQVVLGLLALVPASELSTYLVQTLLSSSLPPRVLPKLDFKDGIPDDCRTMVVVPMMLLTSDSIAGEISRLEVRYLANRDPNISFALLSDFTDAAEAEMPEDDNLLGLAIRGIERLNAEYGDNAFVLFHRPRLWCKGEGRWIGWERKRGKLEELNRLLNGEELPGFVHAGAVPDGIRYVITLDADTQLPHGSAQKLVETIAYPLNRIVLSEDERDRVGGYGIIQPRVSITLPSATASRFSRLFTDARGTDPYCRAVSDLYQDLFGEAIYHGKAIYDVQAMYKVLDRRFPDERLLSHDLIEGAHVGVALASDVELFEQFPYDYTTYTERQHRWIRGDWQIASWILPRVPSRDAGRSRNPLTAINRWKIADNLRRSVVPLFALALVLLSWGADAAPRAASGLVALILLIPLAVQLMTRLVQRWRGDIGAWREAGSDLNRAIVMAAFLPHQAYKATDAIIRAAYRLTVSHRHLLEWHTAEMSHWALGLRVDSSRSQFLLISGSSGVLLAILAWRQSPWEPAWTPFLLLWVAAPAVGHWIGSQRRAVRRLGRIGPDDRLYLRRLARETWRFFDDLVGPEHHYLPPDNSQEALRVEVAGRTSPTNIGMWLTSAVSARDFGWLTPEELVELCQSTMDTLEGLERCEGHLLNWYNTRTLEPLSPKYVSTVDSGNLIASLWVLAQSMEELERSPLLDGSAIRGLNDTRSIIMERFESDHTTAAALETLEDLFRERPSTLEVVERIRLAGEPARKLTESLRWSASEERTYWFQRLERQIETWTGYFDRYLRWVEILAAPPDRFLEPLGEHAIRARRRILRQWPTLGELASGASDVPGLLSESVEPSEEDMPQNLVRWLDELGTAYRCARTEAQSLVERARRLARLAEETADGMNMRFLFDNRRRLFAIGYHVGDPLTFTSHYDLLASEARLSSLVAIAKGDAPLRHWLALGRPYTSSNGQVLLSWNGAMFEYLMPLLFTRTFRNSLLEDACLAALRCQIEYAEKRRVPWGISESAHSAVDVHRIYQYRAFGAPALALRRGAESDLVVAPYATVLALLVDPVAAVRNLRRLEKAGVHGRMGFYDALDFTVQRERHGKKGVVVYTYMAHHQGMSLTAINIVLNDDVMRRRFHADRRIKAVEPLLFERVPPQASLLVHQKSDEGRTRPESEAPPPQLRVLDENTPVPRVHLLGNGRYSVMITSSGAGYSRWGRFDISRWRSDPTTDEWGMVIYMRDRDTGTIWSATHHPLGVKDTRFTAIFSADRAEFRRRRRGVESHLEVTVSPEDDVEVRRLTLTNRGLRSRSLDFISAVEISLAPHEADRAHQAFSKLFIRTEAIPEMKALLAWRRLRSESEPPIWTAQIVVDSENGRGFEFETDRATFIGRGRGWRDPAMSIEGTEGYVLDPVLVIKRSVDLEPRQERRLTVVTVAAASREEALRLIAKYSDPVICNRTFEVAWSHAHLEYRYLGIRSDAAFRFNELASHLLYPNSRLRAPSSRLARNTLGQSKLWAYGVSGDLPIAVVSVAESEGLRLVREVLVAHTYWRLHGFLADLIILNRESADYEQPVQRQLERLIAAHSLHTGVDKPGGVFLRRADHIPEDALNLILTVAAATLGAVRGPLSRQLTSSPEPSLPAPLIVKKQDEEVSAPLPFLELPYFNGLGGFTADGREYAVYLGPGVSTPLPWINVMSNATFGTFLSESGSGCTWYGNSHSNRLTPWTNDPVSDPATEAVYVRDEETGSFWTPTALPVRELDAYRARHGQGYTVFEHNSHALELELLAFVPVDGNGGDPVRLQRLKIRNASGRRKRRLSVTAYSELVLSEHCETTRMHIRSSWDDESKALLARNPYHRAYPDRPAFLAMEPEATSFTGDRTEFLGRYGSTKHPAAMSRESLSNRTGVGFDPCGALQTKFDLLPGEEKVVILMLGQARDMPEARSLVARYRDPIEVERAIGETRRWWDDLLDTIQVETPVLSVNFLMNRWLIYQTLSCRIWGRTALYQSSGAFGFRDQLQDGLALVHADAKIARQMILTAASRQFIEGDVQHWWHLPSGEGIRSRCSDDLLWLPFAVCHYVEATGDREILGTTIAFLDGPPLGADELESYFQPEVSTESASLYEHCRRAIEKGLTAGPQGLPLIGTGDWNDGMNSVGDEGRGESVWLAWFLIDVLNSFARLSDEYGDPRQADEYRRRSLSLAETVERTSWDGAWYLRAFFDDLSPLGSRDNPEASIDSLSQSWAVISGAAAPERASEAMRSVARLLVKKEEKLVLLNTPPFEHSTPNPGYIQGYPPGVRENGGQYTHGALWVAKAFARMGNGDRAVEVLQMLNPVEHARTPTECLAYGTEPYAVAADVYSLESRPGRGGWTWYTGSAGWMYRVWLEDVLGFRLRRDRLTMEPVLPAEWPGFTMTFRYGRTRYRIIVENGQRISPKEFVLEDDGRDHEIRVHPDPPAAA